jgi:hypothetical protein
LFFSDAIINENYDFLKGFLEDLAPPERSSLIQDWETSGLVYLDYIQVIEMLHHIQQVPELLKPLPGFSFPQPFKLQRPQNVLVYTFELTGRDRTVIADRTFW